MAEIRILPAARERILEIWDYTFEKWDEDQADHYVDSLISHLDSIPRERLVWRVVKEKRFKGIYSVRYKHHFIFFREFVSFIGIISILHESMDIPSRLKEDSKH